MNVHDCPREQDLLDALASLRWPDRCGDELRAHVAGCGTCADTLAVALPLLREAELAHGEARIPSAGTVWWRAQMRAREEAARTVSRPITIIQVVAIACAAVLVVLAATLAAPNVQQWGAVVRDIGSAISGTALTLATFESLAPSRAIAWSVLGLWMVLAPLAAYLAVSRDSR